MSCVLIGARRSSCLISFFCISVAFICMTTGAYKYNVYILLCYKYFQKVHNDYTHWFAGLSFLKFFSTI